MRHVDMWKSNGLSGCGQTWGWRVVFSLWVSCLVLAVFASECWGQSPGGLGEAAELELHERFEGERAYRILKQVCEIGPRPTGSPAMARQIESLEEYFRELGLTVERQGFRFRHSRFPEPVSGTNLVVRYQPEAKDRILLCCHYDTRPFPERDLRNPRGRFIGANDGASGVALMCELARHLQHWQTELGVDIVLFDAEELIYDPRRDELFMGSTFFSQQYANEPRDYFYRFGVLVDMIGDAELELYYEKNSLKYARGLSRQIWSAAEELGVEEFVPRARHEVRDDHLPLNQIARIPTTNLIDFDYPSIKGPQSYWHTTEDTPEKCSAESLEKVGRVLLYWLATQQ